MKTANQQNQIADKTAGTQPVLEIETLTLEVEEIPTVNSTDTMEVTVDYLERMANSILSQERSNRLEIGDLVAAGFIALSALPAGSRGGLQVLTARRAMIGEAVKFRSPVTFPSQLGSMSEKAAKKYGKEGLRALVKQSLVNATVEQLENPKAGDGLGSMRKAFLQAITK